MASSPRVAYNVTTTMKMQIHINKIYDIHNSTMIPINLKKIIIENIYF